MVLVGKCTVVCIPVLPQYHIYSKYYVGMYMLGIYLVFAVPAADACYPCPLVDCQGLKPVVKPGDVLDPGKVDRSSTAYSTHIHTQITLATESYNSE